MIKILVLNFTSKYKFCQKIIEGGTMEIIVKVCYYPSPYLSFIISQRLTLERQPALFMFYIPSIPVYLVLFTKPFISYQCSYFVYKAIYYILELLLCFTKPFITYQCSYFVYKAIYYILVLLLCLQILFTGNKTTACINGILRQMGGACPSEKI